jgi:hypothetical protein
MTRFFYKPVYPTNRQAQARRGLLSARRGLLLGLLVFAVALVGCAAPQTQRQGITVNVQVDGKQLAVSLPAGATVQNAVQQAGLALNTLDRVEPPSFTLLAGGETIKITRVREVFIVQETTVPFERQTIRNESLAQDKTLLVQQGINGIEQVTYRQVYEDEEEVSNSVFKKETILEPQPEIMMVGVQKPYTAVLFPGKVAYLSSGNAWVMETSTGNRRPVVTTGDLDGQIFALSPKGDWLLFSRQEKRPAGDEIEQINTLWAVDITEETGRPVNLKVSNVIHFAAWVPGKGLTITYSTVQPRAASPGWLANNDLRLLTFSPSGAVVKEEVIFDTNMSGLYGWWGTNFAWSADGSVLAYARPDEVGLVDLEGKRQVPLLSLLPFQTGSTWAWVPGLGWSANNTALYLVTHAPGEGQANDESSPWFDLAAVPLGDDPYTENGPVITIVPKAGMFAYPVPAPSGAWQNQVAYLQSLTPEQSDSRRYRLVVMDRDGSNGKTIFPAEDLPGIEAQQVVWSPQAFTDSRFWIAATYQGNLWFINTANGDGQQITADGLVSRIDWK